MPAANANGSKLAWVLWSGALLLCVLILGLATHARFNPHEHNLPGGCDEFGYLNMARAMAEGNTFTDHARRPFIDALIADLGAHFPDTNHYRWMIAPHAYHLGPHEEAIINQYPPGVGLFLAWLPIELRRTAFPVLSVALGALAFAFAGALDARRPCLAALGLLPLAALLLHASEPVILELRRVNSLAPTYGLLIAAGWLLPRKPHWSLFLLSATTLFRLPNALLFAPMGLAALFLSLPRPPKLIGYLRPGLTLGATLFASGFGLYLLYAGILLGNPLSPTYSSIDQEFAAGTDLPRNLQFYFVDRNSWLLPHLVALGLLGAVSLCRRTARWFLLGLVIALFNYLFYLFHKVQIDYYPYASSLLVLGLALGVLQVDRLGLWPRRILLTAAAAALALIASGIRLPEANKPADFPAKLLPYRTAFADSDVVWAEFRSGTVEYASGTAGFRYNWGPDEVRSHSIQWLRDQGYRQAIWLDDEGMKPAEEIIALLDRHAIPHTQVEAEGIGTLLLIPPK